MSTSRQSLPPWSLATLLGLLILLMSRGLLRGYSYWHDELFSIGAASAPSWTVLFRDWIIPDTHPPLHLVLLKVWVALAGPGELGTRLLSLLPAGLALVAMALFTTGGGRVRQFTAITFLGTSPLFVRQAQDVRPYAWGVLLAVLVIGTLVRSERGGPSAALRQGFRGSVLLLSLTHYFGLLFGLVVVGLDLLGSRRLVGGRAAGLGLLAAMLAWPVAHATLGLGLDRTDWIDSTPVLDVLNNAIQGVFPAASVALPLVLVLALMAWLLKRGRDTGGHGGPIAWARLRRSPAAVELRLLLRQVLVFLLVVVALDLRKPVSVERYFFVLLPSVALLLGDVAQLTADFGGRSARRAGGLVLTVILTMHLIHSQEVLTARIRPTENYKALATFLAREGVCGPGCWSESARKSRLRPYFDAIDVRRAGKGDGDASRGKAPLPFVGLHGEQKLIGPMLRGHPGASCWEPVQSDRGSTYVILPADAREPPGRYELRHCVTEDD
jgi:hypothetical protein